MLYDEPWHDCSLKMYITSNYKIIGNSGGCLFNAHY